MSRLAPRADCARPSDDSLGSGFGPCRSGVLHADTQDGPCVITPTVMLLEVFRAGEGVDLIREAVKVAWRLAR